MAKRKRKPRVIHVHGRRWFAKTYGNTYHSAAIWVDGECVHKIDFAYGYGDMYLYNAADWLEANGYLPGREQYSSGGGESLWRYCERHGIKLVSEASDVARKRDLWGHDMAKKVCEVCGHPADGPPICARCHDGMSPIIEDRRALLAALEFAVHVMEAAEEVGWDEVHRGDRECAIRDARAAIAEATGEEDE